MQIRQIVFPRVGEVALESVEADLDPGPGQVALRTLYSLISAGTEVAKFTGLQRVQYPFTTGGRSVGEVIAVGEGVTRVKAGDLVFAHTLHVSHAKTGRFCAPMPADLRGPHAPALGLALVAMTAVRVGRPELGDWAVVFGMGMVGNLAAQLYQLSGARVIGVDLLPARLETARACGIEHTLDANDDHFIEQALALTGGEGADYVVEATGNPRVFETACAVARRQGQVILLGSPRGEHQADLTPVLNSVHLWRDHGSLTFRGAHEWRYPLYADGFAKHSMERNARAICALMQQGKLCIAPLISHVVPPDEAPVAFAGLRDHPDTWTGVVFDWTG